MENNVIKKNRTGLWGGKGYEENGYIYKLIEKNGMGEERDNEGHLRFKGSYLNGERHGKGK